MPLLRKGPRHLHKIVLRRAWFFSTVRQATSPSCAGKLCAVRHANCPLEAHKSVSHPQNTLPLLSELVRRGEALERDQVTAIAERERLLREIIELGGRARDGGVPRDDWDTHELNWLAYCSDLRRNVVRQLAALLIHCEQIDDARPHTVNAGDEMKQIMSWWQNEGGREEFLAELPIEERRALERQ